MSQSPVPVLSKPAIAEGGTPEYVLTFPVPGPHSRGQYVLLTLTPDGRSAAVFVDRVVVDEDRICGYLYGSADQPEVVLPKSAPWMTLRRELLQLITKDQARRRLTESLRSNLEELGACPLHGESCPPGEEAPSGHPGNYI